jgi:ABC-type sulfate transport system permease component
MMHQPQTNAPSVAAVFGGTLSGIYQALQTTDVLRTVMLAAIGALVSFVVTWVLRKLFDRSGK